MFFTFFPVLFLNITQAGFDSCRDDGNEYPPRLTCSPKEQSHKQVLIRAEMTVTNTPEDVPVAPKKVTNTPEDVPVVPKNKNEEEALLLFGVARRVRSLLVTGLIANILYLVGSAMFVAVASRELMLECDARSDTATNAVYVIGFVAFMISALLEFYVDIALVRTIAHGRYSTKRFWNLVISALFSTGTVIDLVAFIFWGRGRGGPDGNSFQTEEENSLWVSTSVWLLTSLTVLAAFFPDLPRTLDEGMDGVGNLLFLVGTVLAFSARFFEDPNHWCFSKTEIQLDLAAAAVWLVNAAFYVSADIIRLARPLEDYMHMDEAVDPTDAVEYDESTA
jgi:hypothetical protein